MNELKKKISNLSDKELKILSQKEKQNYPGDEIISYAEQELKRRLRSWRQEILKKVESDTISKIDAGCPLCGNSTDSNDNGGTVYRIEITDKREETDYRITARALNEGFDSFMKTTYDMNSITKISYGGLCAKCTEKRRQELADERFRESRKMSPFNIIIGLLLMTGMILMLINDLGNKLGKFVFVCLAILGGLLFLGGIYMGLIKKEKIYKDITSEEINKKNQFFFFTTSRYGKGKDFKFMTIEELKNLLEKIESTS